MKLFLFILLSTLFSFSIKSKVITICYENREVAPYWMGNNSKVPSKQPGLGVEQIQYLDKLEKNAKFTFKRFPWKRCQNMLRKGKVNGIIGSYKRKREEIGVYPKNDMGNIDINRSISKRSASLLFKLKNDSIKFKNGKFVNLKNRRVGGVLGYSSNSKLKELAINVLEIRDMESLFVMLEKKRLAAVLVKELPSKAYFLQNPLKKKVFIEFGTIEKKKDIPGAYLILSHQFYEKNKSLAEALWNHMPEVRKEVPNIAKKYFLNLKKK